VLACNAGKMVRFSIWTLRDREARPPGPQAERRPRAGCRV